MTDLDNIRLSVNNELGDQIVAALQAAGLTP